MAALIGWEPIHLVSTGELIRYQPPGVAWSDGSPPNVDDMLGWLAERGWCTTVERLMGHPTPVLITLRGNDRGVLAVPGMFTSVRDAAEAAVRAVAAP